MDKNFITSSAPETQKVGERVANHLLKKGPQQQAVVLALQGNLGSGKTTFLQGFAKGLQVKELVLSPTFVIQKRFPLKNKKFKDFYHIDCYRLHTSEEMVELGFKEIMANPENIVAIEWAEKIQELLPKGSITIAFHVLHGGKHEIVIQ